MKVFSFVKVFSVVSIAFLAETLR